MRGSLKLVLGLGLISVVAFGTAACGDDDEGGGGSGGGKGGTGGSGGTTTGGTGGGTAGSGGTSGSGGGTAGSGGGTGDAGLTCGTNTCDGWKIQGAIAVPACCAGANKDKCGADVSATTGGLIGVAAGCYEVNQPGNVDCTACPQYAFLNPLTKAMSYWDGCCLPDNTCGYNVDTTSVQGPKIGCVAPKTFSADAGAGPACTPGTSPDGGCPDPVSDAGTDASSDAKAD